MPLKLSHDLEAHHSRDARARQDFISSLRGYILNDMASAMKERYERQVAPSLTRQLGRAPATEDEVHAAMRQDLYFKFYSAVRYNGQEMVWNSVIPGINASLAAIEEAAARRPAHGGSLNLDPTLPIPENVADIDVHLMPGGYAGSQSVAPGAVYDNGLAVFSAGFMGAELDDIGMSMAHYVAKRFPDFHPQEILDCGCTVGHNTLAWARTFPDARVHAIDVSASVLKYAHGRAESLGVPVHFAQMDATRLDFEDESLDVVFSSMFLHELSLKDIARYFAEARRVLRPGGLLLTMELPPNRALSPYDQFYLDWDCYYNAEPFYRAYRNEDPADLMARGGFSHLNQFEFTVPQYTYMSDADFTDAILNPLEMGSDTGRLSASVHWFGFGAWKA